MTQSNKARLTGLRAAAQRQGYKIINGKDRWKIVHAPTEREVASVDKASNSISWLNTSGWYSNERNPLLR